MKVKTKKNILPNNKKYTAWDYIRIPFMSCPGCTLIIGINRIVSAFIPSLVVLITANFIDTAIAVFNGEKSFSAIYLPILLYMLVVIFQNLNYTLVYGFINIRYDMAIYHNVRSELALKRGHLEYRHIEDNESWNLISRVCDDSLANIAYGMNNLFDIADLVISIVSILAILMTQVWWVAAVIMIVAIPLILTAIKGGREVYDARREVRKYVRRENYLHNVLTKRDYIEERALFDYSDKVQVGISMDEKTYPEGYDTMLSREFDGVDLSGGQWQRIAIGRAFYREHELIVLDEPTSAIDPYEETRIYNQFAEISKDKTSIIVTHRLGSVRLADRIVVMKSGTIVQVGTHDELIKDTKGEYARLYNSQEQWYTA